ncbi:MAG TPA: hypothetical protein VEB64_12020 [Azospirillaceae bacterium]|nr:hypothetical protein [Azospirillaceae bacterium]
MMTRHLPLKVLTLGALLSMAAAPGSLAQMNDYGDTAPDNRQRMRSSPSQGTQGYQVPADMTEAIRPRMGPAQRQLELVQTTLLNQFASLGYVDMRDFRREGERYLAQVQNRDGNWVTVEINPITGDITTQQ